MRVVKNVVAIVLLFFGAVWFLQGLNMFPGKSFMNGQIQWSIYGGIAFVVGLVVLVWANKRPRSVTAPPAQ